MIGIQHAAVSAPLDSCLAQPPMTVSMPDVARSERPRTLAPLDWVGMQGIDVPVRLPGEAFPYPLHARVDAQVDLPDVQVKGIHMSRLHRLVHDFVATEHLEPSMLERLLRQMVSSHADCGTTAARLAFRLDVLCSRPALVTPGLRGWQRYPVVIDAELRQGEVVLSLATTVMYSSTCPCSAALARQLVEQAFVRDFGAGATTVAQAAAWIGRHASLATPHSQRSLCEVKVVLGGHDGLDAQALIARVEAALGTAVQTAVKRADEQAFARLNGANLMYVEDAARRVRDAFRDETAYRHVAVCVRHLESLHPHDALASVNWSPLAG